MCRLSKTLYLQTSQSLDNPTCGSPEQGAGLGVQVAVPQRLLLHHAILVPSGAQQVELQLKADLERHAVGSLQTFQLALEGGTGAQIPVLACRCDMCSA